MLPVILILCTVHLPRDLHRTAAMAGVDRDLGGRVIGTEVLAWILVPMGRDHTNHKSVIVGVTDNPPEHRANVPTAAKGWNGIEWLGLMARRWVQEGHMKKTLLKSARVRLLLQHWALYLPWLCTNTSLLHLCSACVLYAFD